MTADLVVRSFEIAAERCDDLAPLVFERLFREMPEVEALFRKDSKLVRGEMLARTIEAILDFCGDAAYGGNFIASEATTHSGYDVAPHVFVRFFPIVAASVKDVVAEDWSPDMDAAWRKLLADINEKIEAQAYA